MFCPEGISQKRNTMLRVGRVTKLSTLRSNITKKRHLLKNKWKEWGEMGKRKEKKDKEQGNHLNSMSGGSI